ncbi:hypothetical protein [Microbacterium kunmingense]|uniref:hypothetical protein n=1 Tax=Microbacterium kunmingense TaxID=2915939 RepID=UPI003D73CFA6
MLVGSIRSTETQILVVEGDSLASINASLAAQTPEGFELVSAPVTMRAGSASLSALATFARRNEVREIEADDMAALEAQVPEGWQLLSVLRR